jgi:hypothetical protein
MWKYRTVDAERIVLHVEVDATRELADHMPILRRCAIGRLHGCITLAGVELVPDRLDPLVDLLVVAGHVGRVGSVTQANQAVVKHVAQPAEELVDSIILRARDMASVDSDEDELLGVIAATGRKIL